MTLDDDRTNGELVVQDGFRALWMRASVGDAKVRIQGGELFSKFASRLPKNCMPLSLPLPTDADSFHLLGKRIC